ncbi:hypothetical protein [Brevibacillus fortis]|uniref:Uncharacterized protein n=1 Tax=Brevibacillus fortis TaxID=2126352 RepID=A0A2P7V525_9BACL|nr:hypothetical protein [Brevibacillus fortis]PSJ94311.1 hypothetical protein C7R93_16485 [Brevibacillus fortis]
MKKLAIGLVTVTFVLNIAHLDTTFSFLTSEKKQQSPITTGTNEDVFVTDTEQIVLKTEVIKQTKVTRKKNADGTTSESSQSRLIIHEGVQRISFIPKREHLTLGVENITVTGFLEGEVTVEVVEAMDDEKGIVFRIGHNRHMVGRESKTEKGELQITDLGGFYTHKIPLTLRTAYKSKSDVSEVTEPGQPSQPGTPDTPAPGGGSSEPSPPPPTDNGTPTAPPTEPSGPAPPTPEEPGDDAPPPDQPSADNPSLPDNDEEEAGGDSQLVDLAK